MNFKSARSSAASVLVAAALGGAGWWWFCRSPLDRAREKLDQGDPAAAVEIFLEILEKPQRPEIEEAVRADLSRAYIQRGAMDLAEEELRILTQKFPRNPYGPLGLGYMHSLRGRDNFAIQEYEKARALDPKDIRPRLNLAGLYTARLEFEAAKKCLAEALALSPGNAYALERLGDLYFRQGRFQAAVAQYQLVLDRYPTDLRLARDLCRALLYSGDLDGAEKILSGLDRAGTSDEGLDFLRAQIAEERGASDEAQAIYQRLYHEDNNRLAAGLRWAMILARRGQAEDARKLLDAIQQRLPPLTPDLVTAANELNSPEELKDVLQIKEASRDLHGAYNLTQAGISILGRRYSEAEKLAQDTLSISPGDYGALQIIMELKRLENLPLERLKWADKAVGLYKEHPYVLLARAEALLALRRLPAGALDARAAAEAYPRLADAQAVLAETQLLLNNPAAARTLLNKALVTTAGSWKLFLIQALTEAALNHPFLAEEAFHKSLRWDPGQGRSHAEYARFLTAQGRKKDALVQWAEAARLEPSVYGSRK